VHTHYNSVTAQHNLPLHEQATRSYLLTVHTRRNGDMNRISDASGCDGSADTSATTGSQSGGTLSPGSLSLTDPGSTGSGGGDANVPFNQTNTAHIDGTSNGGTKVHTLTFTCNGSVRSHSCEA